ncbi:hypothetical protein [Cohnella boryungensis]
MSIQKSDRSPSNNAFGVLRQPEKLCGDDSEKDKLETYRACIAK